VLGNVLAITPADTLQLVIIGAVTLTVLTVIWKDLMLVFFDESHARAIGVRATAVEGGVLHAAGGLHRGGDADGRCAFLVIALVVTPGATAYLLTDRFPRLIVIAVAIGSITCFVGVYLSYFLDGATGGVVIMLQTGLFLLAFLFAPRHGMLAQRAQVRAARRPPETESGLMDGFADFFIDPFRFAYMQKAFLITFLMSLPMAAMSSLMVLKGWSLMGDAMSHAVLPGIVMAFVAGLPLVIGAFAAGLFCAVATGWLSANSRVKEDTVMGIVFSGMFGLGIVLHVSVRSSLHLDHILFGDMLGVAWSDIGATAILAALCGGFLLIKWRDLVAQAFDGLHARAIGLKTGWLHYGLLTAIALMIVASLKAVGIILSIALLVAPGAIAFLVARTFAGMLTVAVGSVMLSALIGIFASYHIDSEPAPTMVLVMTGLFIVALVVSQVRDMRMRRVARG
jgi:manganese/iron transport system permease protein